MAVVAAGGVDSALEAFEDLVVGGVGLAQRGFFVGFEGTAEVAAEDLGFDGAEAAEEPFVRNEGVEQAALFGVGGGETVVILGGQGFEVGRVFGGEDHFACRVDAGFQGVVTGYGFALDGAWAGGLVFHNYLRRR